MGEWSSRRFWVWCGAALLAIALPACGKSESAACDNVRQVLLQPESDAWTEQCRSDLRACDLEHPTDNPPLYNCLGGADTRGDLEACMRICTSRRFQGRSFMAFGERLVRVR